jgi:Putative esterase
VVTHPGKFSRFKVFWQVSFLLIFCLFLVLFISAGAAPQGPAPQRAGPHQVAAAPDNFRYLSTDAQGIKWYSVISADMGYGPQTVRVLTPAHPASGVSHNFLIVLPVEAGLDSTFGDGLATLRALDAQDEYNLTIIEPTFAIDPWYANNPNNPNLQYETFMTKELVPWIKRTLATTGHEQVWLIGFSKSGLGAQDLILKHPHVFTLAASWDSPFDASSYDQFGDDSAANYGTNANFQANYRLTRAFVHAHRAPFLTTNRIWIGGYGLYQADDSDYDALLNSEGIAHSTETPQYMAHRWDSGWVPIALAALYQDSLNMPRSQT